MRVSEKAKEKVKVAAAKVKKSVADKKRIK